MVSTLTKKGQTFWDEKSGISIKLNFYIPWLIVNCWWNTKGDSFEKNYLTLKLMKVRKIIKYEYRGERKNWVCTPSIIYMY